MPLTGFFENVEEGIILEDDTLPSQGFFKFCEDLLIYYRGNEKIMHISGNNFYSKINGNNSIYHFSIYPYSWGWATWKRAWKKFDVTINKLPEFKLENKIENIIKNKSQQRYWLTIFDNVYENKITTAWDYQWIFTLWINAGLAIIPNTNLVANLGFSEDATHTKNEMFFPKNALKKNEQPIKTLTHPELVIVNEKLDSFIYKKIVLFQPKQTILQRARASVKYRLKL